MALGCRCLTVPSLTSPAERKMVEKDETVSRGQWRMWGCGLLIKSPQGADSAWLPSVFPLIDWGFSADCRVACGQHASTLQPWNVGWDLRQSCRSVLSLSPAGPAHGWLPLPP